MNVMPFRPKYLAGAWSEVELRIIIGAADVAAASPGDGRSWETGVTETGDAQLYLLGPLPDETCELCVSRIGRRYVLEDGAGRLLFEHDSLDLVALHVRRAMTGDRWWLIARIVLVWCTIRHMIHERVEPLLVEGEELLVHLTPQLVALV